MNTDLFLPCEADQSGGAERPVWRDRIAKVTIAAALVAAWLAILGFTLAETKSARGAPTADARAANATSEGMEQSPAQYKYQATEIPRHIPAF
jgi:hypothetical protein